MQARILPLIFDLIKKHMVQQKMKFRLENNLGGFIGQIILSHLLIYNEDFGNN